MKTSKIKIKKVKVLRPIAKQSKNRYTISTT